MSSPIKAPPQVAIPHHRHQSSLEGVIDFSAQHVLADAQRGLMAGVFQKLLQHCQQAAGAQQPYMWVDLLRLTHEYTVAEGRDAFLQYVLLAAVGAVEQDNSPLPSIDDVLSQLSHFDDWGAHAKVELGGRLKNIAIELVTCFFLPFKAIGRKTPQPTPPLASTGGSSAGVTSRVANLRARCLKRDHFRCVISRVYDWSEATRRYDRDGAAAKDDDGNFLKDDENTPEYLEVAHIIPHAIMSRSPNEIELNDSKQYILKVLRMFDHGIRDIIDGEGIDRPYNAMTLSANNHRLFGSLEVYFEPLVEGAEHTYLIKRTREYPWLKRELPVERTLLMTLDHSVDMPSPRLLAIHRACAKILSASGAGEYIEKILRDGEGGQVSSDGSTDLGTIMAFRLRHAVPVAESPCTPF